MSQRAHSDGSHAAFLARALLLAKRSTIRTSPNPRVGCVLVKDGEIVGSGVTRPPGQAHAEIVAIQDAGDCARGSDMYVTLEPCCHVGKTPPCTEAIVAAGIARVFVGSIDPNPLVCGEGIRSLNAQGIPTVLLSDADCELYLDPFRKFIQLKMPWVHLKVASTFDGQLATSSGDSKWITGIEARREAHRIRAQSDAVIVGIGTVLADDPQLNVREVEGSDPVPVILDSQLRVPLDARCLRAGTILFHGAHFDEKKAEELRDRHGVVTIEVPRIDGRLDLQRVLSKLGQRNLINVMVEGGGEVISQFLQSRHANEISLFVAPKLFGSGRGWSAGALTQTVRGAPTLENVDFERFGEDLYLRGRLRYAEKDE